MASSESYASLFTGDELDFAIAKALGNKYRGNTTPGCHLIGDTTDTVIDLDQLLIPGKYTIYFYINGPASFLYDDNEQVNMDEPSPDDSGSAEIFNWLKTTSAFSVRPIYLVMYTTGGDHLYQTLMVGARLYWRDMWSNEDINIATGHIPWRCIDLGIEAANIVNNVEYSAGGTADALSQRMGTVLYNMVKKLEIGNANLLDFTNGFFTYGRNFADPAVISNNMTKYWNMQNGVIVTTTYDDISENRVQFPTGNNIVLSKFPMFDDIDADIISMFTSTSAGATFASYNTSTSSVEYNKIYVGANAKYTASVYLAFDEAFLMMDNTNKAFITISVGNGAKSKTAEIILNALRNPADAEGTYYEGAAAPYAIDKNIIGTDYDYGNANVDNPIIGYTGQFKVIRKSAEENGYYRLTVTMEPGDIEESDISTVRMSFGFMGSEAQGVFVLPKIEYGEYATQYNHSWGDLYYYFTNCESFFGVPINVMHPTEFEAQDSFIYDAEHNRFEAEPVAIGGGGGFVVHDRDDLTVVTNDDNVLKYDALHRNNDDKIPVSYKPEGASGQVIKAHDNSHTTASGYAEDGYQELYSEEHLSHYYPRYKYILFLNKQTNELLYWDDLNTRDNVNEGGFVSINKPFVIRVDNDNGTGPKPVDYTTDTSYNESFVGTNQFWLHKPDTVGATNASKAATIKYYDPEEEMWLTAKADAASIYVVQPNAPGAEWLGKFWINSTTNALYYSIVQNNEIIWKPIFSIWGANPAT